MALSAILTGIAVTVTNVTFTVSTCQADTYVEFIGDNGYTV